MPSTFIFGGSGRTARHVARLLLASAGEQVFALVRTQAHADELTALGATPVLAPAWTADDAATLAGLVRACGPPDAAVWAAGSTGKDAGRDTAMADLVDRRGAIKAMDAAAAAGVRRYVVVSSADVRDREAGAAPGWYGEADVRMSDMVWGAVGCVMGAKLDADRELVRGNARRGLRYTIVRPGGLLPDEPGKGTVAAGKVPLGAITRDDVARVVVHCLRDESTVGLAFDVVRGDSPVNEAVKKVADEKIDCFEGTY